MISLYSDVAYALMQEAMAAYYPTDLSTILNLSSTCRVIRNAALPFLFSEVVWPHAGKHDDISGLHFFPPTLWPLFRHFRLEWPDDWPEATPPRWGDKYYEGGDYHPRHLDKLITALSSMSSLTSFYLSCPFYPPIPLLNALIQCPSLRDLSINETPLYISMIPKVPSSFHLDRLVILPIAETVRVGEGPFDLRYAEVNRESRRRYKGDILARFAAAALLFQVGKTDHLRHIQLSCDLCALDNLADHEWPSLETLVLTGHAPRGTAQMVDVLARMPQLRELRLLFAKGKNEPLFRLLLDHMPTMKNNYPSVFGQLQRLAISNACILDGVFQYTVGLERLAVCAIIDYPRVPTALSRTEVDKILADLAIGNRLVENRIERLRIMMEDKVNPDLCHTIATHCPYLQALEVEVCGYHDGKSVHEWSEYADAFSSLGHLRELRVCIQFPEFDEMDKFEPWRAARRECALYLATRLPFLRRIGFEYRKRTGTHRFEDSWLEFDINHDDRSGAVNLHEVGPTWYPFPEMWFPVPFPGAGQVAG